MNESPVSRRPWLGVAVALCVAIVVAGIWRLLVDAEAWPRGEPLGNALKPLIDGKDTERAMVARVIWENYVETRFNASRWSGVYWGFTFTASVLSALAGVMLKWEAFIRNDGLKKDVAAILSVGAAILIAISSSGDFQHKWQANRIAAAELERCGYVFLGKSGADPRSYLDTVAEILLQRSRAIAGDSENPAAKHGVARGADG